MNLDIGSIFQFGTNLEQDWLGADIKISTLKINIALMSIAPNAFVGEIFENITDLEIEGGQSKVLEIGVFNGLKSLKSLKFIRSTFKGFENGLLDSISDTLTNLTFESLTKGSSPIDVAGLTGGKPMKYLKTVRLDMTLENTIKANTFTALTNVTTLDLKDCTIDTIRADAFEFLNPNIEILDLSRRSTIGGIRSVADGVFDSIITSEKLEIKLDKNSWDCECGLSYLQKTLNTNPTKFSGEIQCFSPPSLRSYNVSTVVLDCDSVESTTSTSTVSPDTPSSSSSTTPKDISTTTDKDSNEFVEKECTSKSDGLTDPIYNVNIQRRQQIMTVDTLNNGSVSIQLEHVDDNLLLVWFSNNNHNFVHTQTISVDSLDCVALRNRLVTMDHFEQNVAHTICLMNKKATTVSPFDCVSFTSRSMDDEVVRVWLTQNLKLSFIGLNVFGFILAVIFGGVIGIVAIRKYPKLLGEHKRIVRVNSHLGSTKCGSGILVMPNEYNGAGYILICNLIIFIMSVKVSSNVSDRSNDNCHS